MGQWLGAAWGAFMAGLSSPGVMPVAIAVAGWLVPHQLSIRAQRKSFINQIKNDARKHIGEALRKYEEWCATIGSHLGGLRSAFLEGVPPWSEERWIQEGRELSTLIHGDAALRWIFALEENEVLFPQLREPRQQLADWQAEIVKDLNEFMWTIWTPTRRKEGIENVQAVVSRIREQFWLAECLHVYLQNLALGPIVGRKSRRLVPEPRDVTLRRPIGSGRKLEFGFGEPPGRAALAWRLLRYGRSLMAASRTRKPSLAVCGEWPKVMRFPFPTGGCKAGASEWPSRS